MPLKLWVLVILMPISAAHTTGGKVSKFNTLRCFATLELARDFKNMPVFSVNQEKALWS